MDIESCYLSVGFVANKKIVLVPVENYISAMTTVWHFTFFLKELRVCKYYSKDECKAYVKRMDYENKLLLNRHTVVHTPEGAK